MKTFAMLLCVLSASTAYAQQRGYYWDNYEQRWTCVVDCLRRGPPPGPTYERPQRNLYEEYRVWGGRERYLCYNQRGELTYCYR